MSHKGSDLLRRLWRFLSRRRRWQIAFLVSYTLVGTFLDTLTLGAVLPFIAVLVDPTSAMKHPRVGRIMDLVGITSPQDMAGTITAAFIVIALAAGAARLGLVWATHRMSSLIATDLSNEVYKRTLYQPFSVHVSRNSSQLISGIMKKVAQTTHVLQGLLTASTNSVLALGIVSALLVIDPTVAILTALIFGSCYVLIAKLARRRLLRNGERIKAMSTRLVKTLQEGLGGIRDVLLDGTQNAHAAAYRKVDRPLRRAMASNGFLATSPRVVMEAAGISGIALLAFFTVQRPGGATSFLPVLGALAIGAQRLLPAFQHVYAGYAHFVGHQALLAELVHLVEQPLPPHATEPPPEPLSFRESLRMEHVSFRYPETETLVLSDINLEIKKGSRVGFVGRTGGGKSTTLDLLMGLLDPTEGQILVDGQPITGSHGRAWQRAIAHVPQSIFLSDTTIAENIAFGVDPAKIDLDRVREAARIAHIDDFVQTLPAGYQTSVGERGVRLSGGQRQRLGIARALYKRASVLIFDEATSALDSATERDLMDAVEKLSRDLTILMIAHRLTTVERCDEIVMLDQGHIVAIGPYQSLLQTSDPFRSLAAHT